MGFTTHWIEWVFVTSDNPFLNVYEFFFVQEMLGYIFKVETCERHRARNVFVSKENVFYIIFEHQACAKSNREFLNSAFARLMPHNNHHHHHPDQCHRYAELYAKYSIIFRLSHNRESDRKHIACCMLSRRSYM